MDQGGGLRNRDQSKTQSIPQSTRAHTEFCASLEGSRGARKSGRRKNLAVSSRGMLLDSRGTVACSGKARDVWKR